MFPILRGVEKRFSWQVDVMVDVTGKIFSFSRMDMIDSWASSVRLNLGGGFCLGGASGFKLAQACEKLLPAEAKQLYQLALDETEIVWLDEHWTSYGKMTQQRR